MDSYSWRMAAKKHHLKSLLFHSNIQAAVMKKESVDERDEDQQLRQEVPRLHRSVDEARPGKVPEGGASGEGGPREGDLDVMSATSSASGQVHTSASSTSQRERRAQIDSCWCNIPDMFVDPASRMAYYWMALVTAAVIYNWIVIILRVAFEDMREDEAYQRAFRVMDMVCDVIYLTDVAIQSRTAYLEDGCLVRTLPETVRHYRHQPYFVLDVLSVVPVTTLHTYLYKLCLPSYLSSETNSITTPSLRVLRLLKYPSMTRFFEKTDSRTNNPNLLRAFKLSLHLWLVIHWIACFYYLLSQYEGKGTNDWVYPNTTEYSAFSRKYIFCLYWSTMTLTTIGERPWPATDVEYIFTGFTFLVGVFVFAAVVGNVGDVISNMNAARHDFQARMDQIKFFLNHRNVPEHLQDQIKRWAEYTWVRTKAIDEHSVLQLLPSRLRTEVAIHVHLNTLKKVRIFEQCEEGLLRELVLKLRPSIYSPGEYICRIGEIGREMYIIDHGKVEILFPERESGQMKQVAIMTPGNYFGEISLLKLDDGQNKRTAEVRSIGFSELLCLSRRDLMAALLEYPEAKKILEAQARQRIKQTKCSPQAPGDNPDHSSPDCSVIRGSGSSRRSAKAVFTEVMRQEGFSSLLSSVANQELNEMKKILTELREIKNYYRAMEKKLKETETGLHQARSQSLMQPHPLTASTSRLSDHMSPFSVVDNDATDISESSTLTSPVLSAQQSAHTTQTTHLSPIGKLPSLLVKAADQFPQGGATENLSGTHPVGTSTHKKQFSNSDKAMPPFESSCFHQNVSESVKVLPFSASKTPALNTRQRRSPSARSPKSCEDDRRQIEMAEKMGEILHDVDPTLGVAQAGGGDDLAVVSLTLKDYAQKDQELEQCWNKPRAHMSETSSRFCKILSSSDHSVTDFCTSLGSAVGSRSTFEIVSPSTVKTEKQLSPKPQSIEVRSEQTLDMLSRSDSFKSLISESNSSSQNTSYTDTSTTSSSSGGRGHSPKPAKPKPMFPNKRIPSEDSSYVTETSPKAFDKLGGCQNSELNDRNTKIDIRKTEEVCRSSEILSAESVSNTTIGVCRKDYLSVPEINTKHHESVRGVHKPSDKIVNNKMGDMKCEPNVLQNDGGNDEPSSLQAGENSHDTVGTSEQQIPSSSMAVGVGLKQITAGVKLSEDQAKSKLAVVGDAAASDGSCCNVEHGTQNTVLDDLADSDVDSGNFIMATRVKSDFDKRISMKDLDSLPQIVTCRKIDDTQLSILLAKRREVNDSADYIVESSNKPSSFRAASNKTDLKVDHGHSICSLIDASEGVDVKKAVPNKNEELPCQWTSDQIGKKMSQSTCDRSSSGHARKMHAAKIILSPTLQASRESHESESVYEDVVYLEHFPTESTKVIRTNLEDTATCISQQCLKMKDNERLDSTRATQFPHFEKEKAICGTEPHKQSAMKDGMPVNGDKEKIYPVSILKKSQSETISRSEEDGTVSQILDTARALQSAVNPIPEKDSTTCSARLRLVDVHEDAVVIMKDTERCKSEFQSTGKTRYVESDESNLPTNRKQRRNRNVKATLQMNENSLNDRYDPFHNAPVQLDGTVLRSSSCFMDDSNRSQHPILIKSADNALDTYHNQKEDENLLSLRRQYSAARYRRRSIDKTSDSDNISISSCPVVMQSSACKEDDLTACDRGVSSSFSGSQTQSTRKYIEEKFTSPTTTADPPHRKHEQQEVSKYMYFEIKTNSVNNSETETVPREPTEKGCRVNEMMSNKTSRVGNSRPSPAEKKAEVKEVNSSSTLPIAVSTSPPKRKTLRRRSLTKRTGNSTGKKDVFLTEKGKASQSAETLDSNVSTQHPENRVDSPSPRCHQDMSGVNTFSPVTLTKNLVWEARTENPSNIQQCRESQFDADESPLSQMFDVETNINCCSGLIAAVDPLFITHSSTSGCSMTHSGGFFSCPVNQFGGSEKKMRNQTSDSEDSFQSSHVKMPDYNVYLCEEDVMTASLMENGSPPKGLSFEDKLPPVSHSFNSRETLNRSDGSVPSYIQRGSVSGFDLSQSVLVPDDEFVKEPISSENQDTWEQGSASIEAFPNDCSAEMVSFEPTHEQRRGWRAKPSTNISSSVHGNLSRNYSLVFSTSVSDTHATLNATNIEMQTHSFMSQNASEMDKFSNEASGLEQLTERCINPRDPLKQLNIEPTYITLSENPLLNVKQQRSVDTPQETTHLREANPKDDVVGKNSTAMKASQEDGLESMMDGSLVERTGLHPDVRCMQNSPMEGEVEQMRSLILLADFGVRDDDEEEALSDVSGCGDQSDVVSDLDDL